MYKAYTEGTHKVVEINDSVALRNGDMISQVPYKGASNGNIDNGFILELDATNGLKLVKAAAETIKPIFLHYTEELFLGNTNVLSTFTVELDGEGVAYPRALALYVGDTFTTDNVNDLENAADGVYVVVDGVLQAKVAEDTGHAFYGRATTMPDGVNKGIEFTYLGLL